MIGPNGAGKSTLINLISGKNHPTSGTITFKGVDITRLKPYQVRQLGITRSFQITNVFPTHTVYENVRLAVQAMTKERYHFWKPITHYEHIDKATRQILRDTHLEEVADFVVGNLSYAQKRLLEIALSLAGAPSLILLDEPAAGLSMEESQWLSQIIKQIARTFDLSVVFIEHDMDVVFSIADYITVLHYGKIVAEDVPQRIKENSLVKEIYLGNQGE